MDSRLPALIASVALLALPLPGCLGSPTDKAGGHRQVEPIVLTLADADAGPRELAQFAELVERRSRGSLRIRFAYKWRWGQPGFEEGIIRDVQAGKADLGWAATRAWDSVGVSDFDALHAPLLIDSYALEGRVIDSRATRAMLAGLRPLGLQGIAVLPGPLRRLASAGRPLVAPGDLRGLHVGIQESRVARATFHALGASPLAMPWRATSPGRLDAIEQQLESLAGGPTLARLRRSVTANVILWPRPLVVFAGKGAVERLSTGQLNLLRDAGRDAIPTMITRLRQLDKEALPVVCRGGSVADANPSNLAAFRAAVRPVYAALEQDPAGRASIQRIRRTKRELAAPPDVLPHCRSDRLPASPGKPSALDGLYRMTTNKDELARARGILPEDVVPENWGEFIFALARGRLAFTTENALACTWAYGRYSVKGNVISVRFHPRGGGLAPTGAINMPTQTLRYRWSRYRDLLRLQALRHAFGADIFVVHQWRRVGSAHSVRDLSPNCRPPRHALG
ncbi:MAG TPA: TRAP transporter substrate-binding protein DctP [Thermoleophilaceae bacterium]